MMTSPTSLSSLKLMLCSVALMALAGCHSTAPFYGAAEQDWSSRPAPASSAVDLQLFLIGDAGYSLPDVTSAEFTLLKNKLAAAGQNSAVVFLGDNIYPKGLPDEDDEQHRPEAERRLIAQLELVKDYPGQIAFIPGNHDWKKSRRGGWEAVQRQEDFVKTYLGREDVYFPGHGCPGPAELNLNDQVTLLLLDTEWWLHKWDKPGGNDGICEVGNRTEFIAALDDALRRNRKKKVVVAGHHPLFTHGKHGGHFPLKEHIFPLTAANENLYVPLPIIGSLYPIYRKYAGDLQDLAHPENKLMQRNFLDLFANYPNLVYASGHEHSLQYFNNGEQHYIVSGSGSKTSHLVQRKDAGFGHEQKGFAELQYLKNGEVWMQFWEADQQDGKVVFRKQLQGPDPVITEDEIIAQYDNPLAGKTTTVVPGPNYAAGKTKRKIFGDQYRDTWTTPIEVPYLDLRTEYGGLTPLKKGGGQQTKSLRFRGADGHDYVVRSIQKYPAKAIPEALRNSVAADVVQDLISIAHPYGAIMVPPLADAAGVFHANPSLVVLPPDPILGEYLDEYQGELYLYEERPARDQSDTPWFGSSKKIIGSPDVYEKIRKDHDNRVDEEHFLRSRLFDILIGDWDRHEDQWRWARYKEDGKQRYKAIPRDRDQVFVKFDGFLPGLANRKWGLRKFQPFGEDTRDIAGLCFNGRYVDRNFLVESERADWVAMANDIKKRVTDQVIEEAIGVLPAEAFALEGERLVRQLKVRRDRLPELAERYYDILAKEVEVVGSDKRERFEVVRKEDNTTQVTMWAMNKKGEKKEMVYQRTFLAGETKEVRLFGLGGKDEFHLEGTAGKGPIVRIIGGSGKDKIKDDSKVKGLRKKTVVYDTKKKTELDKSGETKNRTTDRDPFINTYDRRAFKYNLTSPLTYFGYNLDDGVFLGGGALWRRYAFRKDPYKSEQKIVANYAAATRATNIRYFGNFTDVLGKWDLFARLDVNTLSYVFNYFGEGNESIIQDRDNLDFNRVRLRQGFAQIGLKRSSINQKHHLKIGLNFQTTEVDSTDNRITANDNLFDANDFEVKNYSGLLANYTYESVDSKVFPTHGFRFIAEANYLGEDLDEGNDFVQLKSEASAYFSVNFPLQPTFAVRVGGATNIGDYEFFQANTLGGLQQLRGLRRNRFNGQTSFYQNTEMRFRLFQFNTRVAPFKVGGLAYADIGRVWEENDTSDVLHQGIGGGVWLSPLDLVVITGTYTKSDDDELIVVNFGFFF